MSFDLDKIYESLFYNKHDLLLFNSSFFLFFFAIVLCIYQFLYKRKVARVVFFTLFSLYFFYKACGWYVVFILAAAVIDFNLSNWIHRASKHSGKKALLVLSIIVNLSLLVFFKYTNLFIQTLNDLNLGHFNLLELTIPVGISFYTFENLSYTIDVYRGKFKPVTSFLDYCFFLSFFPKLVMGPIVRASDFIPQIRQDIQVTKEDVAHGLYLIMGGLIKKVVISDYINVNFVQYIFDDPTRHSGIECLLGVYGYALVIYCDFSGYSDMAIGMAKWMGFTINVNFDSPYQSGSITEFWRRWHISLSSWLRDYLYISLGGNRKGKLRQYFNLMTTMLLGGLWHGASWNFVMWGGMHGLALSFDKMRIELSEKWRARRGIARGASLGRTWFPFRVLGVIITFHFVCFCWIFFRAKSFTDSTTILTQIFTNFNGEAALTMFNAYAPVFYMMLLGYAMHFTPRSVKLGSEQALTRIGIAGRIAVLLLVIWITIQVKQAQPVMPIYLQF